MRRWKSRYDEYGYDGLFDRRRRKPSPKRVPMNTAEEVLRLYREKYPDLNVRHFHEKLEEVHGIELSYTWVKLALQGLGWCRRGGNVGCIGSGGRGDHYQACCCTWTGAGISGFRTTAGMT
jgi:hypothetical protein